MKKKSLFSMFLIICILITTIFSNTIASFALGIEITDEQYKKNLRDNPYGPIIDDCLYWGDGWFKAYLGYEETLTIPSDVCYIYAGAFQHTNLKTIIIKDNPTLYLANTCFSGAYNLTDIYIYKKDLMHIWNFYDQIPCKHGLLACTDEACTDLDVSSSTLTKKLANVLCDAYDVENCGSKYVSDTITIHGYRGSTAEQFVNTLNANPNKFWMARKVVFQPLDEDTATAPLPTEASAKTDISFSDIAGIKTEAAILELASRGIINGMGEGKFQPNNTMTRAQFATIVTKSLGYEPSYTSKFKDVPSNQWYAGYVGAAYKAGIVNGRTESKFDPEGLITRQEAAVMVSNAAKLCSMNTTLTEGETKEILAVYSDYTSIADWAKPQMAFCYAKGIYNQSDWVTNPTVKITRGEIAQMLYNMLNIANLS